MDKKIVCIMIILQIILIVCGVYLVMKNDIILGLFNIIINTVFMTLNLITLKSIKENETRRHWI